MRVNRRGGSPERSIPSWSRTKIIRRNLPLCQDPSGLSKGSRRDFSSLGAPLQEECADGARYRSEDHDRVQRQQHVE